MTHLLLLALALQLTSRAHARESSEPRQESGKRHSPPDTFAKTEETHSWLQPAAAVARRTFPFFVLYGTPEHSPLLSSIARTPPPPSLLSLELYPRWAPSRSLSSRERRIATELRDARRHLLLHLLGCHEGHDVRRPDGLRVRTPLLLVEQ
jgi:hypothetical protein